MPSHMAMAAVMPSVVAHPVTLLPCFTYPSITISVAVLILACKGCTG